MSIRRTLQSVGIALLLVLGAACGGNGNSPIDLINSFVLKSNVIELDKSSAQVTSVTPDTVVLTSAPALAPDQVIVHNALDDTRFLRKVVSVDTVGNETTVTTAPAGLEDVFDKANILQRDFIEASDLLSLVPAQPGVEFLPSDRSSGKGRGRGDDEIVVNFTAMEVKDDGGNAIAEVSGSVRFAAGIETRYRQNGLAVEDFAVAPFANVNGSLTARGRASGSFVKEIPISLELRIPVTALGPLGVNCSVQLMMRVEGSFSAEGQFVITAGLSAKEGVQYTNGSWSFVNQFDKTFSITPPNLRASLEMGVSLIRPKIGADILGIGEVSVTADVLKVLGRVTGQTQPLPGFWVECLGDFTFSVGGRIRLGPITLWETSWDFNLGQFHILQPFLIPDYGPTDTYIAYVDLAFQNIHAMNGDGTGDRILVAANNTVYAPDVCDLDGRLCYAKFNTNGKGELWICRNDGSGQERITDGSLSINHPQWSPDGREIAFDASDPNGVKQIYVANVATKSVRQMTSETRASRVPAWTADGRYIYFERMGYSGKKQIAKTRSDAPTFDTVYADDTVDYAEPSLSPNGMQMVCLKGSYYIVVSDDQGRNQRVILGDQHLARPSFSPDGQRIVLQYNDIGTIQIRSYQLDGFGEQILSTGQQAAWGVRH